MLKSLNPLVSLCKRRGYIFPSSEIYGGLAACWDYGPLGAQFKLNIKEYWWKEMVYRSDITGLDSSILMNPKVWEASGHVSGFSDPMVDCKNCSARFRLEEKGKDSCPKCGSQNLGEPREFNLMFQTQSGSVVDESNCIYLRPETAQGIYLNFLNIQSTMRKKIPFGVAQIGKAFRNEITTGNFLFRCCEFEQMEMQYFVHADQANQYFEYWREQRKKSLIRIGIPDNCLREHEHGADELAHYAHKALDLQFLFPMGWKELEGVHHRGDFDLKQHQKMSGKKLMYVDTEKNQSYIPSVIETSIGLDRLVLALLCVAYKEEEVKGDKRVVLSLNPHLSPVHVAVLPLSKKQDLMEKSCKIADILRKCWRVELDDSGSIGKRYRRQDEIGTPFCVTVDFDSLEDKQITFRHRDSMQQERVSIEGIEQYLADKYVQFMR